MALASQALKYNYVIIQPIGGNAVDLTAHLQYIEYFENIIAQIYFRTKLLYIECHAACMPQNFEVIF